MKPKTKTTKRKAGSQERMVRQVKRLKLEVAAWEYAASLLRTGMGLKDGTDLWECLMKYKGAQADTAALKAAEDTLRKGVIRYIKDSEKADKPEPVDRLKFLLEETLWW